MFYCWFPVRSDLLRALLFFTLLTTTGCQLVAFNNSSNSSASISSFDYGISRVRITKGDRVSFPPNVSGSDLVFSVSPALPQGIFLNPSTGVLSTSAHELSPMKEYVFTVKSPSKIQQISMQIEVVDHPPRNLEYSSPISTLIRATTSYSNDPQNEGGQVVSYSISPPLPSGLSLDPSTGRISGVATVAMSSQLFTITGRNSGGETSVELPLEVLPIAPHGLTYPTNPVTYTSGSVSSGELPTYSGDGATLFTVSSALPDGLSLDQTSGRIIGTPTSLSPASSYTVTASNSGGSDTVSLIISVIDHPPVVSYSASVLAEVGTPITLAPTLSGGAVVSFSVSPGLPAGLSLDSSTGIISGTPQSVASATSYTVTATNSGGSDTFEINITVNDQAPINLSYSSGDSTYTIGSLISANSPSSGGGGAIVSYSISPSLPLGLSLSTSTGVISGTPGEVSSETEYTITASNTGGSTTATVRITVIDVPPSFTSYATTPAVYTLGEVISNNAPALTGGTVEVFSISPTLPAGLNFSTSTGVISGTPSGLLASTTFTITATNTGGSDTFDLSLGVIDIAPTNLTYTTAPVVYLVNTPITDNSPSSSGGAVVSYSISPSLPTGLLFNSTTGVISGTPSVVSIASDYTITAFNTGGSTTFDLNLQVAAVDPPLEVELSLWLDAGDSDQIVKNGADLVTSWTDKSSNQYVYAPSGGNTSFSPLYVNDNTLSSSVLRFGGSNDSLVSAGTPINSGDDTFTIAVVWKPTTAKSAGVFAQRGIAAPPEFTIEGNLTSNPNYLLVTHTSQNILRLDFAAEPLVTQKDGTIMDLVNSVGSSFQSQGIHPANSFITMDVNGQTITGATGNVYYQTIQSSGYFGVVFNFTNQAAADNMIAPIQAVTSPSLYTVMTLVDSRDPAEYSPATGAAFYQAPGGFGFSGKSYNSTTASYSLNQWNASIIRVNDPTVQVRNLGVNSSSTISSGLNLSLQNVDSVLGYAFENDEYFSGDIAEILIYQRVLTNSEVDEIDDYFQTKYSLSY